MAKDAADIVLLDKDLGVLADGVMEGRRIFANTLKYVLMATSSNFGNMFSAAGASLFLSFLPMLPSQILLNNLLYDVGQLAIPTDRVDAEVARAPGGAGTSPSSVGSWPSSGPLSSIFDFVTFFVMLVVLHAEHREFRTRLVRRVARHPDARDLRHPHPPRAVPAQPPEPGDDRPADHLRAHRRGPAVHAARPALGFAALPLAFFLILVGMIVAYLVLVEVVKARFYAHQERVEAAPPTPAQRHHRHVRRRAARFARPPTAVTPAG